MELEQIKHHWQDWAAEFKTDLRATTKAGTAKQLEINALVQAICEHIKPKEEFSILEVGCGNGHNCFALQSAFSAAKITGVDFIDDMVLHARELNSHFNTEISFSSGNILELDRHESLSKAYDIVFTVRCIINLNADALQHQGLVQLVNKVHQGGHLILIENQTSSYGNQNRLRELVGLDARNPAGFNHFMDEPCLMEKAMALGLECVQSYSFSSLHDIILYVLVPMINAGKVDYDHPLVQAAADLTNAGGAELMNSFGDFGQNKLFLFKKI